jgi:hypothetical protein
MQKVCMQGLQNIGLYNYWAYIKNVWNPMHVVSGVLACEQAMDGLLT